MDYVKLAKVEVKPIEDLTDEQLEWHLKWRYNKINNDTAVLEDLKAKFWFSYIDYNKVVDEIKRRKQK